jgi:bis(5'-nucleosyl)-tetraphosphatase (symmetrical)
MILLLRSVTRAVVLTSTTAAVGIVLGAPWCTAAAFCERASKRSFQTPADAYYQVHQQLPSPQVAHVTLPLHSNTTAQERASKNILVIGDVHGCHDELLELHERALQLNNMIPFQYVILVGDLVNKGPKSMQVLRHVQTNKQQNNWLTVRGNHDNGALSAALARTNKQNEKYQWIEAGERCSETGEVLWLSDDDVEFLSELPYTIRIPGALLAEPFDTVIVHAGLDPHVESLPNQDPRTMITLRTVKDNHGQVAPWASVWNGPFRVVFGHDAKRGLQQEAWATGLDTGACYGKQLTGLILPQRTLVQVSSQETYCAIQQKDVS